MIEVIIALVVGVALGAWGYRTRMPSSAWRHRRANSATVSEGGGHG